MRVDAGTRHLAARLSGRASGLALAVRPAGPAEAPGQRRAAGASRVAGCGAPLRLEGPARTMRGVPPGGCDIFPAIGATRREDDGLAVALAGAAAGYGGTAGGRSPGRRARQLGAPQGLRPKGAAKAAAPPTASPRVNPGRLPRVTLAAHFLLDCPRPLLASTAGPSGPARRRCALEAFGGESCHSSRRTTALLQNPAQ